MGYMDKQHKLTFGRFSESGGPFRTEDVRFKKFHGISVGGEFYAKTLEVMLNRYFLIFNSGFGRDSILILTTYAPIFPKKWHRGDLPKQNAAKPARKKKMEQTSGDLTASHCR